MFVFKLLVLALCFYECQSFFIQQYDTHLTECVQSITLHLIEKGSVITYVDLKSKDNDIIRGIQAMNSYTLVSRTTVRVNHYNKAYIVTVENFDTFKNEFNYLTKEKDWRPNAYFIIIIREKSTNPLTDLFDILIRYHVFKVVVINGSSNAQIYTYNPFENSSCGKKYFNIEYCGNCSNTSTTELYFPKFDIGLDGCTFKAATSHRAPFSINPKTNHDIGNLLGTEQFVLHILSELEGFKINYTATYDPDIYPVVKEDMSATGPLSFIQDQDDDIVFGGMLLLRERAEAFNYLYEHHAYADDLVVLVKRAGPVAAWKNIYLEFSILVWFLLILTFFFYFTIFVVVFHIRDKSNTMLIMWGFLFQHGYRAGFNLKIDYFIFHWALFAFLINIYYQSSLMGLTTHVSHNYQVSNENDIEHFEMEPCISNNIRGLLNATIGIEFDVDMDEDCGKTMSSMQTVSNDYKKYTLVLHSLYSYNKFKYTDNFGNSLLYSFKLPMNKIIYAIYFYKGFPKMNILRYNALRIRESGLLEKHLRDLFYEEARKYNFGAKRYQPQFFFPWHILIVGVILSGMSLIIELIVGFVQRKRMFRQIHFP